MNWEKFLKISRTRIFRYISIGVAFILIGFLIFIAYSVIKRENQKNRLEREIHILSNRLETNVFSRVYGHGRKFNRNEYIINIIRNYPKVKDR
ncbi:MAG: hypothetical protein KAS39_05185, partial [Actinomycetia bacterium]|nr:hypothetical protein [Actinomycetes bacterium]